MVTLIYANGGAADSCCASASAAATNYHRFSCLTQHTSIVSYFCRSRVQQLSWVPCCQSPKAETKVLAGLGSLVGGQAGESVPRVSQVVAEPGSLRSASWLPSHYSAISSFIFFPQNIYEMSSAISSLGFFKMEWSLKTPERQTEHRLLQNFLAFLPALI